MSGQILSILWMITVPSQEASGMTPVRQETDRNQWSVDGQVYYTCGPSGYCQCDISHLLLSAAKSA